MDRETLKAYMDLYAEEKYGKLLRYIKKMLNSQEMDPNDPNDQFGEGWDEDDLVEIYKPKAASIGKPRQRRA